VRDGDHSKNQSRDCGIRVRHLNLSPVSAWARLRGRYSTSVGLGRPCLSGSTGTTVKAHPTGFTGGSTTQRCRPRKRHWGNKAKPLSVGALAALLFVRQHFCAVRHILWHQMVVLLPSV